MSTAAPNELSRIAAVNNAEWCASVWRSHGLKIEQSEGLWFCRSETPRFYPNVVTVDPLSSPTAQVELIRNLSQNADFEFSVKDSFDCLPLDEAGFERAFSAYWLRRELGIKVDDSQQGWRAVSADDLDDWSTAWARNDPAARQIFRTPLLEDGRVTILARTDRDQRIVAGAIAFDQGGVAGLTNVFGAAQGLFGAVSGYTSARALVAYEPGVSVEDSAKRGFRPLARLAVWKRPRLKVA